MGKLANGELVNKRDQRAKNLRGEVASHSGPAAATKELTAPEKARANHPLEPNSGPAFMSRPEICSGG